MCENCWGLNTFSMHFTLGRSIGQEWQGSRLIKRICKWGGWVAAFPGKGSDDAEEHTEGRTQTGCYLLRLPVQF